MLSVRTRAKADDLAPIINVHGLGQDPAAVGGDQVVKVQLFAVVIMKSVVDVVGDASFTNHLSQPIDGKCDTVTAGD